MREKVSLSLSFCKELQTDCCFVDQFQAPFGDCVCAVVAFPIDFPYWPSQAKRKKVPNLQKEKKLVYTFLRFVD